MKLDNIRLLLDGLKNFEVGDRWTINKSNHKLIMKAKADFDSVYIPELVNTFGEYVKNKMTDDEKKVCETFLDALISGRSKLTLSNPQQAILKECSSVLLDCRVKLQLYRENQGGEHLGGVKYMELIKRTNELLKKLSVL